MTAFSNIFSSLPPLVWLDTRGRERVGAVRMKVVAGGKAEPKVNGEAVGSQCPVAWLEN